MGNIKTSPANPSGPDSTEVVCRPCTKCGIYLPATVEFFYRNPSGKYGLTPRCKPCVDVDNKTSNAKRKARDPEKVRAQNCERTKRHYQRNLEASRAAHREYARQRLLNPEYRSLRNARRRAGGAGLTRAEIDALLAFQGGKCAICQSDSPGTKSGWNLDHCHKTNAVRFILCAHCNRGLGAFKDDPRLMRRAADMLEKITKNPARPVAAIMEKG